MSNQAFIGVATKDCQTRYQTDKIKTRTSRIDSDAVWFALLSQARLRTFSTQARLPVQERIGIHLGEVVISEHETEAKAKDLYGIQVTTCARVTSLAAGGQVLLTRGAFDSARQVLKGEDIPGVGGLSWASQGPYLLKGIDEPVEVCEVGETGQSPLAAPRTSEKAQRQVRPDEEPVLGWRQNVWVAFSPDGGSLGVASADASLKLWNLAAGRVTLLPRALMAYYCVAFSPDGRRLAAAGPDPVVRIIDVTTGEEVASLAKGRAFTRSVLFTPDGNNLLALDDKGLTVWRAAPWTEIDAAEEAQARAGR